ncbi:MAG: PilN domain-containing protein [Gemmatimonadaceae bacterium]|nr:PilN domain-containing protein [Gemmatimonadaceae bacterium]
MIEINLLPGARKKSRSRGPSFNIGDAFKDIQSRVRDPWMISAVAGVVVGVVAIGLMWTMQSRRESSLTEREQKAVQDSTRYASVIAERAKAEAQRDSVQRQIAVISAIDGTRLIWPHVMDEISRAMPPYVWLRSVAQTSAVSNESPEVQAGISKAAPRKGPARPAALPSDENVLALQIVGNTVDIQALTRFMKALEASPFLQNVTLVRSDVVMQQGKEATEFRLDIQYEKPDPSVLRTVPFTVSVR